MNTSKYIIASSTEYNFFDRKYLPVSSYWKYSNIAASKCLYLTLCTHTLPSGIFLIWQKLLYTITFPESDNFYLGGKETVFRFDI